MIVSDISPVALFNFVIQDIETSSIIFEQGFFKCRNRGTKQLNIASNYTVYEKLGLKHIMLDLLVDLFKLSSCSCSSGTE